MVVGVLALQGDIREHLLMLKDLKTKTLEVRLKEDLKEIDGLIIPGGESTTIGKLLKKYSLLKKIREMDKDGLPIYGTCAGMVLLAGKTSGFNQISLEIMDITVKRNAFGRQRESFEADIDIKTLKNPFHAIFIRAPVIEKAGKNVVVLAKFNKNIIMAKEGNLLVTSFHPELSGDLRVHKIFLSMIKEYQNKKHLRKEKAG
ncbi:MAG: pyridoxal 5'-phosphate synthase glutaminase subunit PdxT [Actinomycetia bacterium]|nr:pyridoxal 5'-phosphate synthase glutaminase subunit PdxT [Actinomycetes bacterium]